jgi:pimeloyl-ACP methyl ester carboxylesterase
MVSMHHQVFILKDGRDLGFAVYGPESGQPVLYFHGTPSSRLEPLLLNAFDVDVEALLHSVQIKLIAVDRPGMGLSTFHAKGNFISFTEDVKQLLDSLSVSSCPVLCWSGGGPYALAMAHQYTFITEVYILCGFSRRFDKEVFNQMGFNKWYFRLAKYAPRFLKTAMNILRKKKIKHFVPQKLSGLAYVDYELLKDLSHLQAVAEATLKEACRNGAAGAVYEAQTYFNDLGFLLSAIQQPVQYWWGSLDMSVSRMHAEAVEQNVPNAIMHYRDNEGHLSLYIKGFKEVLQLLD